MDIADLRNKLQPKALQGWLALATPVHIDLWHNNTELQDAYAGLRQTAEGCCLQLVEMAENRLGESLRSQTLVETPAYMGRQIQVVKGDRVVSRLGDLYLQEKWDVGLEIASMLAVDSALHCRLYPYAHSPQTLLDSYKPSSNIWKEIWRYMSWAKNDETGAIWIQYGADGRKPRATDRLEARLDDAPQTSQTLQIHFDRNTEGSMGSSM